MRITYAATDVRLLLSQVAGMRKGIGGLPRDTVQALFNKYDADGSGARAEEEGTGTQPST